MDFRASDFEFRNRFWLIGAIFGVGFFCYAADPVVVTETLARLFVGFSIPADSPALDHAERLILATGAVLACAAALIRSWAESYLHSSIVHDAAIHSEQLVADGPYRHVRNPLYLGNIFLALGMGVLASRVGFVVIVVGMAGFVYRLILREEEGLKQTQGERFLRYCRTVPRLLPALLPRVPASERRPNWMDGFTGELFIWGFAIGMVGFAIMERQSVLWACVVLGFAIYFIRGTRASHPR